MKKIGKECNCIRCREVGNRQTDIGKAEIFVREYNRPMKGAVDINNWIELTSLLEEHNL